MKKLCFAILAIILIPQLSFAGVPLVAGHALTTGQVIVGVTNSAPVANTVTGTANQITVTQGAEGGNLAFSFPANVTMQNLTVTGTLSPYSTGTFTSDNLTANYGVSAATGVFSNTGASSLDIGGGLNAGTGNVGIIDATGKIPAISSTYFASLDGSNLVKVSSYTASAPLVAASASCSGAISAGTTVTGGTGLIATAGPVTLYSRTKAEHDANSNTYTAGSFYVCSDCGAGSTAIPVYVVEPSVMVKVSTGSW